MTSEESKGKRIYRKLIFLPYFIGIFWTCLHPIVSVLTGELKCRGWFLDESAIETRFATTHQIPATIRLPEGSSSLCQILNKQSSRPNIWCSANYADSFDIAILVPLSNAIDPTDEAIVFVVPAPEENNWNGDSFHYSLTHAMLNLADPQATPWLAKTVILVSPSQTSDKSDSLLSLEATVSIFLDAYLGSKSSVNTAVPPLPPRYCQAILRQLIVINLNDQSITSTSKGTIPQADLSVLPQGKRGALPNLDLVTLVGKVYQKASFLNTKAYPSATFLAHGYTQESKDLKSIIQTRLSSPNAQIWANEMVNLGFFAKTLAVGPYPPHWPALDRGIDSLTLQFSWQGDFRRDPHLEVVQLLELVIRALSNLHERLHHSFVLYWLPSPEKFVSHMEYFLPTVLILLPLAVRAFGMVLVGDVMLHLTTIGQSFLVSFGTMAVMALMSLLGGDMSNNACLLFYFVVLVAVWRWSCNLDVMTERRRRTQSLQFAACATAAYLLVPIAFCHSALVYLPAMVLVPLLAFPNYAQIFSSRGGMAMRLTLMASWIVLAPPVFLVPGLFPTYTIFVRFAYIPMHIQLLLLVLLS